MAKKKTAQPTGLQVFNFNENAGTPIRVQVINDEPWFVAKDVCEVLTIGNSRDAVNRLDDDEKAMSVLPTQFGNKEMNIVNESGLYNLIFQSRKPEAKAFRKWVTSEVLPSIRKTGGYRLSGRRCDDYLDWRDRPYRRVSYRNGDVRMVEDGQERWYSMNDLLRCLGSRTASGQSALRLNRRGEDLARKILLYGMTQPGWFARSFGAELLSSGSVKGRLSVQLRLDFK